MHPPPFVFPSPPLARRTWLVAELLTPSQSLREDDAGDDAGDDIIEDEIDGDDAGEDTVEDFGADLGRDALRLDFSMGAERRAFQRWIICLEGAGRSSFSALSISLDSKFLTSSWRVLLCALARCRPTPSRS